MAVGLWLAALWALSGLWGAQGEGGADGAFLEVTTRFGRLRGREAPPVRGSTRGVHAFLGVPFARPPTGTLRFAPPQPPLPWEGVRDATAYAPVCPQKLETLRGVAQRWKEKHPPFRTSEDCLYMNIYAPASQADRLPVMVFIHGGNFVFGTSSRYDGSALAAYGEVLVVTLQYRLGILGFFSTGDASARGNWALLDQVAALRWIQENIEAFGGDPGRVTIFGLSGGSFCVSSHVLSPMSKGLFQGAILHSGIALLPGAFRADPRPSAERLARGLGCTTSTSEAMVACLRAKSAEELTAEEVFSLQIGPVLDGEFMPKHPEEILSGKEFNAVPLMAGVTNHEMGWNVRVTIPELMDLGSREKILAVAEAFFPKWGIPLRALPMLLEAYLGDTDDTDALRDGFLDLLGDGFLVIPTIRTINYHKESGAPVYFFEYQHRPSLYHDTKPPFVKADHGDEISFVFGGPFLTGDIRLRDEATAEEEQLSQALMRSWANFARRGDPNGGGLPEWPPYNAAGHYLVLNLTQQVSRGLKEPRLGLWAEALGGKGAPEGHAEL
nr:carboxylesterase 5A-like [Anolis sagrei ordinatus]